MSLFSSRSSLFPLLAVLALVWGAAGCRAVEPSTAPATTQPTYTERYRPRYHFTPAVNWMNDPNGLVYFEGEYHLFYQYNPFGNTWGHMSWGHAVSRDLVHWEHLPVALPEADGVMAFSGSAVVDRRNTTGFGADGRPPLVAIYTGHRPAPQVADERQAQHLAYSTDRGRTWIPYAGNPVLDLDLQNFRDPKVFWYAPGEQWVMVVALSADRKVQFYASEDLKAWTLLSEFGPAGSVEGIWECPDLFELSVDGNPDSTRWVLQVDLGDHAVAGGSGGQYFVGDFDGTFFTTAQDTARWVDYGADFYAAVSWSDVPPEDGRRLWIGWMNNWQYAQVIPTAPWRSAQSLPRSLALQTFDGTPYLTQQPVAELHRLRGTPVRLTDVTLPDGETSLAEKGVAGTVLEVVATFEVGTAEEVGLKVRVGVGEETIVGYDVPAGEVFVDRTRSGDVSFHPSFAARHAGPLPAPDGRVRLHVFVDASSVEVFAGDGRIVLTDQIFPAPSSDGVELYAHGGTARLVTLEAWSLASIWQN